MQDKNADLIQRNKAAAEDQRTRQRLEEIKQKTFAQPEAGKKRSIENLVNSVNAIKDQVRQLESAQKASALTSEQQTKAKLLNDQIKKELTMQNELIAKHKQRIADVQKTEKNKQLVTVLLIASAFEIKRRNDVIFCELLECELEEALEAAEDREKEEANREVNRERMKDPGLEEEDDESSPGKRLSRFVSAMKDGMELSPDFNIEELKPDGTLKLTDKQGRVLDPDDYLKQVLPKFSPKPTPGGTKKQDEDPQQAQTQSSTRSSISNPGATPKLEIKGG